MTRRASLPGVDELFRSSKDRAAEPEITEEISLQGAKDLDVREDLALDTRQLAEPEPPAPVPVAPAPPVPAEASEPLQDPDGGRRRRHEEKVTFYCTASDLTRIERARLTLRAEHRVASDRGRIVRAALSEILDDFEANGASSALVRRLKDR